MRNKRGVFELLGNETVRIVLAVVSIIILVYLAWSMYGLFTTKTRLEQGRATLNEVFGKIESLSEGQRANYLMVAPTKWYLVGFGKNNEIKECNKQACLCSCDKKDCSSVSICKISDFIFSFQDSKGTPLNYIGNDLPIGFEIIVNKKLSYRLKIEGYELFFSFDREWKAGKDTNGRVSLETIKADSGISKGMKEFIGKLETGKTSLAEGVKILKLNKAEIEEGSVTLQTKK